MRTALLGFLLLIAVPAVCIAADGASGDGHANPCDEPAIFSGPSSRGWDALGLDDVAVPTREEPRLVWHCGTPDPPPPPQEALTARLHAAVTLRAPPIS